MIYAINDIFPTIQGEGMHTGTPAVFIRLQGCRVHCHFCDTKETWAHAGTMSAEQSAVVDGGNLDAIRGANPRWTTARAATIAEKARSLAPMIRWAVVTGGEPAEQRLQSLVWALHEHGFLVALETSGTALGHIGAGFDHVVVSPKVGNPAGLPVLHDAMEHVDELKWIVGKASDLDALDAFLAEYAVSPYPPIPPAHIALQPMSANAKATALCVERCIARGFRLSIQVHRLIGLD